MQIYVLFALSLCGSAATQTLLHHVYLHWTKQWCLNTAPLCDIRKQACILQPEEVWQVTCGRERCWGILIKYSSWVCSWQHWRIILECWVHASGTALSCSTCDEPFSSSADRGLCKLSGWRKVHVPLSAWPSCLFEKQAAANLSVKVPNGKLLLFCLPLPPMSLFSCGEERGLQWYMR